MRVSSGAHGQVLYLKLRRTIARGCPPPRGVSTPQSPSHSYCPLPSLFGGHRKKQSVNLALANDAGTKSAAVGNVLFSHSTFTKGNRSISLPCSYRLVLLFLLTFPYPTQTPLLQEN